MSRLDPAAERSLAVELFNHAWTLLDKEDPTEADQEQLIHCAHASAWHWSQVGTAENRAVSEWQVARVYATLGRGEPAVHHSRLALAFAETVADAPWVRASAYEGLARAYAVAGQTETALDWRDRAVAALDDIAGPEDRAVVERDIATLPL